MSETVDRSKCHPDCGKTMREHALSDHDSMGPGWVASSGVLWCSLACRTAKLPPIVPAKERLHCRECGWFTDVTGMSAADAEQLALMHRDLSHSPPAPTPVRIGLDINDASELTNKPPAPTHVERRPGQRWRLSYGDTVRDGVLTTRVPSGWRTVGGEALGFSDRCWRGAPYTMTLIADAPDEKPDGAVACPRCGKQTTRIGGFCSRECEKAGAIPTCVSCLKSSPTVATRVVRKGRVEWCDACFVESDSYACLHEGLYGVTGTPCAQPPGLLPKPRMAADWYEDCLPEVR